MDRFQARVVALSSSKSDTEPAMGLGSEAPWSTAPSTHLYGAASHIVFGTVTDGGAAIAIGWWK